jgi:putative transposase
MPEPPHRKSLRIPHYDYHQANGYFVTICTHNRACLFGTIENAQMLLNEWGKIAQLCWLEIPKHLPNIEIGEYVIMPNHMHGLIFMENDTQSSLPTIVGSYKSAVSRQINATHNPDKTPIWQRSYHDQIVHDPDLLTRIHAYIRTNPAKWSDDQFFV